MFRRRGYWVAGLVVLLLVGAAVAWWLIGYSSKPVVATYKDGEVTREEFDKQFHFQRTLIMPNFEETDENKRKFLEEYITLQKVMVQKAQDEGIKIDEQHLDQQVKEYKDQVVDLVYKGDANKFNEQLAAYKITDEDIKQFVKRDAYLRQYREAKVGAIAPAEDDMHDYFETHKSQFATGTLWHILVKTEEEATKVKERLAQGEEFSKVAKEVSIDPTAQQNGGKMADVKFDMFVQEFRDAAATLPLHQLSNPVRSEFGWHIIRVDSRTEPNFKDVQGDVEQKLKEEKQAYEWNKLYEQANFQAHIKINLPAS